MRPPSRALLPAGGVDLAVVAVLVVLAVLGFGPVWGGTEYLVAALGALALGLALAWWGARSRVGLLPMAAATIVTYVLAGGALALRATTALGVLPTLATVRGLLLGAVDSWKDVVTASAPLSALPELLVVPYLATLVVSVLAGSLALRARRPAWALAPTGLLFVGVILLGSSQPALPITQGTAFALVALGWTAWRTAAERHARTTLTASGARPGASRRLWLRRLGGAAAILAVAGSVTAVAGPALVPDAPRRVLRDVVVPPLDVHDYPSPLVAFRRYVRDSKDDVLFTVAGLPPGARVRLATLDAYTGTVLDVAGGADAAGSGTFARGGRELARGPGGTLGNDTGIPAVLTIDVGTYRGVWVPGAGQPSAIRFAGKQAGELTSTLNFNPVVASALVTAGLTEGDRYTVQTVVPTTPEASALEGRVFSSVQLPVPEQVPESVAATADAFVGQVTAPVDQVENLSKALVTGGQFSNGLDGEPTSRAGHGADRIDALLTGEQMIGDDEQYAVAMTLMARQLGIPARVVMGFYPGKDAPAVAGRPYAVRGADVHAWVEVAFDGIGWVPFDAVPDKDTPPQEQDPRSQSDPQPQQLQPPLPPDEPAKAPTQPVPDAADDEEKTSWFSTLGRYLRIAATVVIPVGILVAPFALIAAIKTRRRLRRRQAAEPADRISGGWSEVMDTALDLGLLVAPPGRTRREAGAALVEAVPRSTSVALAARADAGVFGPGDPDDRDVEEYWDEVNALEGQLNVAAGRWRRLISRASVRSLRGRSSASGRRSAQWLGRFLVQLPQELRARRRRSRVEQGRVGQADQTRQVRQASRRRAASSTPEARPARAAGRSREAGQEPDTGQAGLADETTETRRQRQARHRGA